MSPRGSYAGALSMAVLAVGGCASTPSVPPPDVPASLQPPPGQRVFLEALASGVQIYECVLKPDGRGAYHWTFRGPEATLKNRAGGSLGTHFAGPTWSSSDGSTVVAAVTASDPGPAPSAIPWLLLTAKSVSGTGQLGQTASIQRVNTVGGVAPAGKCDADNTGQQAKVPYTADYYFYRAGP